MSASAKQKTFGEGAEARLYSFGVIPPVDAIDIQVAIVRIFGEGVLRLLIGSGKDQAEQLGAFASAIKTIAAHPNARALKDEIKEMLATAFKWVTVSMQGGRGAPVTLETTFTGRNREMWMVFAEAVRVNFADFFPASPSPSEADTPPS